MALFSGKIVDAYYSDPDLKFIEVLYEADEQQKKAGVDLLSIQDINCLLYTSPSPRDRG